MINIFCSLFFGQFCVFQNLFIIFKIILTKSKMYITKSFVFISMSKSFQKIILCLTVIFFLYTAHRSHKVIISLFTPVQIYKLCTALHRFIKSSCGKAESRSGHLHLYLFFFCKFHFLQKIINRFYSFFVFFFFNEFFGLITCIKKFLLFILKLSLCILKCFKHFHWIFQYFLYLCVQKCLRSEICLYFLLCCIMNYKFRYNKHCHKTDRRYTKPLFAVPFRLCSAGIFRRSRTFLYFFCPHYFCPPMSFLSFCNFQFFSFKRHYF